MAAWIIVVDDDISNLKFAGHVLSRNNMRVTAIKSGITLINYLESNGFPDLILLDINMPDMDGFETLEKLREFERRSGRTETPVVFLTADEDADTEKRAFDAGASDLIRKPFIADDLVKCITEIIAGNGKKPDPVPEP